MKRMNSLIKKIKSIPRYIVLLILFYLIELVFTLLCRNNVLSIGCSAWLYIEYLWMATIFIYLTLSLILLVVSVVRNDDTYKNVILLNVSMVVLYYLLSLTWS